MSTRKRLSWHPLETLEREPRNPLIWLGQCAAADHRVAAAAAQELHRRLLAVGYAVVRSGAPLPLGTLLATLAVTQGARYRLVQLANGEVQRLMAERGGMQGRSMP